MDRDFKLLIWLLTFVKTNINSKKIKLFQGDWNIQKKIKIKWIDLQLYSFFDEVSCGTNYKVSTTFFKKKFLRLYFNIDKIIICFSLQTCHKTLPLTTNIWAHI